jgi:hypothetical protein
MTSYSTDRQQPTLSASKTHIPYSMTTSKRAIPIESSSRVIKLPCGSGSGSFCQGTSGLIFNVPTGRGYLKGGSTFLQFKLTHTGTTAGSTFIFSNASAGCSALINNVRININGQAVENLTNYGLYHKTMLSNFTSKNHVKNTAGVLEGAYAWPTTTVMGSPTYSSIVFETNQPMNSTVERVYEFVMPIASGVLMNNRSLPLFLMNQLQIQIDLAGQGDHSVCYLQNDLTADWKVSDLNIIYELIELPSHVERGLVDEMRREGKAFELTNTSYNSFKFNRTLNTNNFYANIPTNFKSLDAVLWTEQIPKGNSMFQDWGYLIQGSTSAFSSNNERVLVNQQDLFPNTLRYPSDMHVELKRVGGALFDYGSTPEYSLSMFEASGGGRYKTSQNLGLNLSNGYEHHFVRGLSCKSYHDDSTRFCGKEANNVRVELSSTANTATTDVYTFLCFSQNILLTADKDVLVYR